MLEHSRRCQNPAEQPSLGVGDGHLEPLERGDLVGIVLLTSVHLKTVDQTIFLLRGEESGSLRRIGENEDTDDGNPDGGYTFYQAVRERKENKDDLIQQDV